MTPVSKSLDPAVLACLDNARRLNEDAEWYCSRPSARLALTLLAQEEAAKSFLLVLVRDGIIPWTPEVRRALSDHVCKNLIAMAMGWLFEAGEASFARGLGAAPDLQFLPPNVATAMNILRHEIIERFRGESPERVQEWSGEARRVANGKRDKEKQASLYVSISSTGEVGKVPETSEAELESHLEVTKSILDLADQASRACVYAFREYRSFCEVLRSMFADLAPNSSSQVDDERFESGIPGVVLVRRTITVAEIDPSTECHGRE